MSKGLNRQGWTAYLGSYLRMSVLAVLTSNEYSSYPEYTNQIKITLADDHDNLDT